MSTKGKFDRNVQLDLPSIGPAVDSVAFEEAIRSNGLKLVHYSALKCPVGLVALGDSRRPDHDHEGCSNGFIYTKTGCISALFQGNNNSAQSKDVGLVDGGTAVATFATAYNELDLSFYPSVYDRFYIEDCVPVATWEMFQTNLTGRDRTLFPIHEVVYLMDSDGRRYTVGSDFNIVNGAIVWIGSNRPGLNVNTGQGVICSIRYLYRPYWYAESFTHEIRIAQTVNFDGTRTAKRMPQQLVLKREYFFRNEQKDDEAKDATSLRQNLSPQDGSFGPR